MLLPECLEVMEAPVHIAMIMDGNGRWAKKSFLNRIEGHEHGAQTVRVMVETCLKLGIKFLTLYAFSTENWNRPKAEIRALMQLLKEFMISERQRLMDKGIRLNIIGQMDKLPLDVRAEAVKTMALTQNNMEMILNLAVSYGSRSEITFALRALAEKVKLGKIGPSQISESDISDHLYTAGMPDPDLIIRTSGEFRMSNFLLWQAAYSEIYITKTLWPDFTQDELIQILRHYQERNRRFGKV